MVYLALAGLGGRETKLGFGQDQPSLADKGQNGNTNITHGRPGRWILSTGYALSCENSCLSKSMDAINNHTFKNALQKNKNTNKKCQKPLEAEHHVKN